MKEVGPLVATRHMGKVGLGTKVTCGERLFQANFFFFLNYFLLL